jgi:ABC-type xylose transport system permease subunit
MSEYRSEKDEKADEKTQEKQTEKEQEKQWDEKWRRNPLGAITFALILIWAGLVLLADNLNLWPADTFLGTLNTWSLIFLGAGLIILAMAVVRLIIPEYRSPIAGSVILGFVFIGIGLSSIVSWQVLWAVILIAIGVSLLLGGAFRSKK